MGTDDPVAVRMHVDHCFEALRLSFMCYSDITPVLIKVDHKAQLGRKADFNVHHKCRNFEKIVNWVDGNGRLPRISKENDTDVPA
jgi:Mycotoxin biosynthesis protein UstYa